MLRVQILHLFFELIWRVVIICPPATIKGCLNATISHSSWLRVMEITSVWNIYGTGMMFFGKHFESKGKNAEYGGQPKILALEHVIERPIIVNYEDSDKGTVFGEFFTDRPGIDILYYLE